MEEATREKRNRRWTTLSISIDISRVSAKYTTIDNTSRIMMIAANQKEEDQSIPSEERVDAKPSPEDDEATLTTENDNTLTEETSSANEDILAELRLLEEIDMNNEDLDMLEWMTRKLISIPKTYYWDHSEVDPEQVPTKLKLWHRSVAAMGSVVRFTDRLGAPITNALGLTASRFDYVTSTMTERDWERSRQSMEERRISQREDPSA